MQTYLLIVDGTKKLKLTLHRQFRPGDKFKVFDQECIVHQVGPRMDTHTPVEMRSMNV